MSKYEGYLEAKRYYRDIRNGWKRGIADDERDVPAFNLLQDLYITLLEDLDDRRPYLEQLSEFKSKFKEEDYPWMIGELFPGRRVGSGKGYNRYIFRNVWKLPIE